jgi:hypothetical protein
MSDIGLTSQELTDIRSDVDGLLPDTCTIQQMSTTVNSVGEAEKSYTPRASNVPCRLDPDIIGGWEVLGGFMDITKYTGKWRITLKYNQYININDRVIITTGGTDYIFEVDHVDIQKSWRASTRAILERVSN